MEYLKGVFSSDATTLLSSSQLPCPEIDAARLYRVQGQQTVLAHLDSLLASQERSARDAGVTIK